MLSLSVLIPLIGYKDISNTIESVIKQNYKNYEIIILRNNITDINKEVKWKKKKYSKPIIKELLIKRKGKGNALNEGIKKAKGKIIAILDADCIIKENALIQIVKHFDNKKVVAVGGRLLVKRNNNSLLEKLQSYEYMKTFQVSRRFFSLLNATCLISGAFGAFRKSALFDINGYDTNTIGEDMELVLRLQDNGLFRKTSKIIYEPKAICETNVPVSFKRLFFQRDRWQRGLLDSLLKHKNMILNPFYGFLGIITMLYQVVFELLGPFVFLLYYLCLPFRLVFAKIPFWGYGYMMFQFLIALIASFLEEKNIKAWIKKIPLIFILTIISFVYELFIMLARIYGMITFHNRRLVW